LNDIVAIVDFAMSCVYALFWFAGSVAVADNADDLLNINFDKTGGNLIAGLGFGFICTILYGVNIWFCFKDTPLFERFMGGQSTGERPPAPEP